MSRRFGKAYTDMPSKVKEPGSRFMESFERVKRDFGYGSNEDDSIKQIGPLAMKTPESDFFDPEENMINLTKSA